MARGRLEPSLPLSHRARRPTDGTRDVLGPVAFMRQHYDPGALDDQMGVAPPPHERFELAQQVALDVESTWAWSARHAMSIDAALRLFPKPGSNFRLVVLVIDDGPDIRSAVVDLFQDRGFLALSAAEGRLALDLLEGIGDLTELPCAIVLDLMMPVMDGWTFRREQRRR